MNVFVESDFVLALALRQDDHQAAQQLLELASQGHIHLKVPAFSLSEPFATVQNRANTRNGLLAALDKEIRELGRTEPHKRMAGELGQYTIQMAQVLQTNLDALEATVLQLSHTCELLQLDTGVLSRASSYKTGYSLKFPDAIILASVALDLERMQSPEASLFISQNFKDFELPGIQDALQRLQCKYLADFTNAIRFITRPGKQTG